MLRILVVSPDLPRPDQYAGGRRFCHILRSLAQQHRVHVAVLAPTLATDPEHAARLAGMHVHVLAGRGWAAASAVMRRPYDIVLFEFWRTADEYLDVMRSWQPHARIVVDTVDVSFSREQAGLEFGRGDAATVADNKARELAVYRASDALITITPEDEAFLAAEGGMPQHMQIPIAVPVRTRASIARGHSVLFIGGFGHPPNVDGITWFVDGCWDRIRASVQDAHLLVIGTDPPPEVQALATHAGVEVRGHVPSTEPYLDAARVSVAPLRYGAGMKGKVCEAMACGMPVVTTAVGAQGLGAADGEDLLLAEEPVAFGDAVIALLMDEARARAVGQHGQALIAALCGEEKVERQVLEVFQQIAGPPRRFRNSVAFSAQWLKHQVLRVRKLLRRFR